MRLASMEDLLIHELKDLYSAESQLIKALPKVSKAVSSESLREAIDMHLEETKSHKERLDDIFKTLDASPRGHTCKAMEGLIEETGELIKEDAEPAVKDAALIAAAQRVEHYEIAAYGAAATFAQMVGNDEIAQTLQETLAEEKAADEKLNDIALSEVNRQAVQS